MTPPPVPPASVTVSGIACGWATVATWQRAGFPVVDSDDPSAHDDLVRRAAAAAGVG
ncbi:hypothetical protein [Pseudonocardia broussonetiae]|uniref:Uncharacterized protein n=1 Tax=Pseudonocardia broussonetiae TaxID=2736640 RepID=A0A6M6JD35_9PSEU|nr:hypothetical protein [Pseudonocardia broussonetiae]QJY44401.1 hypothetical protein HOP40_00945 [Pseudonocardia broussonetiae]